MCVFGASVQRMNFEIKSLVIRDTHRQDHNLYRMFRDANTNPADVDLLSRHSHRGFNMFRQIPCMVSDLPKPDLLHTMKIGMLDHLQKWICHFMKIHEGLDKYNGIWLSVPAYHDLTPNTKSYEEVPQWNGKEMKEMSRYRLEVVTQSLRGWSPAQRPICTCAIDCTWALLKFYMYARYNSHDDATLSYMEDALCRLHTFKEVLLLGRVGKKVKAKAKPLRTELVMKRKVAEETNAETWTPSIMPSEMNTWPDDISHEIDVSKELEADFNIPKIHLMSHLVEQIRRYGAFQQYSAERHEQAHQTNLKEGWNASNPNHYYLPQVITFQGCILCLKIRELNHQALAQSRENSTAACTVLPSAADLAAPLGSQSYAKPEFMVPQHRRDGKHPDAMIKAFRAFLDNTQDATHCATLYNGTQVFLNPTSLSNRYISDEQLHAMELCMYHGIKVQVEGLECERISQICRYTRSESWRGGDQRND